MLLVLLLVGFLIAANVWAYYESKRLDALAAGYKRARLRMLAKREGMR